MQTNPFLDPLISGLLQSQVQFIVMLGKHHDGIVWLSASPAFRNETPFDPDGIGLIQRYGMDIFDAIRESVLFEHGFYASVLFNQQWKTLKIWSMNSFAILEEQPIQTNTTQAKKYLDNHHDEWLIRQTEPLVLHLDVNGIILHASNSIAKFMRMHVHDLHGTQAERLIHANDRKTFLDLLSKISQRNYCVENNFRIRNFNHQQLNLEWIISSHPPHIVLIGKTARNNLELALIKSKERTHRILESMNDAFFALDNQSRLIHINEKGCELLQTNPEHALGQFIWEKAAHLKGNELLRILKQTQIKFEPSTFQWQHPKDSIWYHVRIFPNHDLTSVFFTDISHLKRDEHKMRHQALHDPLTGLPNRLALAQTLNELLANDQVQDLRIGLLFIDLDGFKLINDTMGHDKGDQLLIAVAQRLRKVVRNSDIVARLSGDEFVITLPYIPHPDAAYIVGKKVVHAIAKQAFDIGENPVYVGASVGVSLFPNDALDAEGLLKHADIAMYQAKQAGKNTVRLFNAHMSTALRTKVELENQLHDAIKHDRIELVYQPRFGADGRVVSVEALARLRSRNGELVSPAHFIPIAEDTGLIVPLGEQVLKKACEWLQDINQRLQNPIGISVNVSGIQLLDGKLCQTVEMALQQSGLSADQLELELTETVLMQNYGTVIKDLHALNQLGIKISIDDFGTGYSSLSMLHKLPIQTIKLDRSFVAELPNNADSVVITRTVLALARALNLDVVAEGVETDAQLEFLLQSGVRELQGFGLAKPMPAADLENFLIGHQMGDIAKQLLQEKANVLQTNQTVLRMDT